jgi:AraC-like DNA-binding protein
MTRTSDLVTSAKEGSGAPIMAELVRVAALTGYHDVAGQLGLDPLPHLRAAGLGRAMLLSPEQVIPAQAAIALLESSAEASSCPTFGLRMAACRSLADLGMISLLIAHQPTLRDALAVLARNRHRMNSTLVLSIDERPGAVVLREDFALDPPVYSRQASDLALGVLAHMCSAVLGPGWHAESVCFSYSRPAPRELEVYRQLFRCPVHFDAEFNGLVLDPADLDRPNPRAEPALAAHAGTLIESVMAPDRRSLTQEVEHTILMLLPAGRATIKSTALALGLNLRTLQRGLEADGTSFTEILDRLRAQLAQQHLANPRMRLTDIADLLGYSSLGAFTRWYGQTFGVPPSSARKALPAASRPAPAQI